MITIDFLIISLIVVLIPGTGVLFTVSTGLFLGRRASVFAALGCTAGIVPHLLAAILGLAAVLHVSAVAFQALRFAGVAYLLFLAWVTWRDKEARLAAKSPAETDAWRLVAKAILLNLLNPKLTLFFLAFLPQFVSPSADPVLAEMLMLSGVFMAMTFVVFTIYGMLAFWFRAAVIGSARVQQWLRRGFAAAYTGLGLNLAFAER